MMAESTDTFIIDGPGDAYLPGDVVSGEVLWELHHDADELYLTLGWWTSGTGSVDESVVDSRTWKHPSRVGKEPFRFTLPPGPFSFSGKLISLEWGLQLNAKNTKNRSLRTFVLSPTGKEVDFSDRQYESQIKSFSIRPR